MADASPSPSPHDLADRFRLAAREAGFDLYGFAPAIAPPTYPQFLDWLAAGHHAGMDYLDRRQEAYAHPQGVLDGVRSLAILAMNYAPVQRPSAREEKPDVPSPVINSTDAVDPYPRVARYAQITGDYHDTIRARLRSLCDWLQRERPGCLARGVVDTAPLLERDFARQAGLGWFGKNTLLINRQLGSWLFLAAVLTDVDLPPDDAFSRSHCGSCTRCLDACPTQAFPQPYVLDARRCIAYWTIEHRGAIPAEVRPELGDWLFGCDVCQEVCPWNRKAPPAHDPDMRSRDDLGKIRPEELLAMDETTFRATFRGTPLLRSRRAGMARNAAIVLGNRGDRAAIQALSAALKHDDAVVRSTAAWALGQMRDNTVRDDTVREPLTAALATETVPEVIAEIRAALAQLESHTRLDP